METVIVVGAGHGGARGADCLRRSGFKGRLILVGDESHLPYQRPPLCKKFLVEGMPVERLVIRHAPFYVRSNIQLRSNARVVGIDRQHKRIEFADGGDMRFDKLMLCLGSRPRILNLPGSQLTGIHTVRALEDAQRLRAEFRPGCRMVVVGGGYIGLEAAATARGLGLDVTVVEAFDRVLQRVASPSVSEFYKRRHSKEGVKFLFNSPVKGFSGKTRVGAVEIGNGVTLPADVVLICVGNVPETELAASAGLQYGDGILVDEHCRTSDPNIYAAGDCTYHPNVRYGRRVRLQSIDNAIEQARVAAAGMCGREIAHTHIPWFWSDQYDTKLQIAGLSEGYDEIVTRGDPDAGTFSVWCLRQGELVAVEAINQPLDFMQAGRWIAEHKRPDPRRLGDLTVDLASL